MKDLEIKTLKEGSGQEAKNGNTVVMRYTGKLTDGTTFDSNQAEGLSFKLGGGQVIAGWDKGIVGMKIGEQRLLTIPPHMAYGERGFPGAIPPNATLVFEVELIGIK